MLSRLVIYFVYQGGFTVDSVVGRHCRSCRLRALVWLGVILPTIQLIHTVRAWNYRRNIPEKRIGHIFGILTIVQVELFSMENTMRQHDNITPREFRSPSKRNHLYRYRRRTFFSDRVRRKLPSSPSLVDSLRNLSSIIKCAQGTIDDSI